MAKNWKLTATKDIKAKSSFNKILLKKGETITFVEDTWSAGMVNLDYVAKVFEQRFGETPDFGCFRTTREYFDAKML